MLLQIIELSVIFKHEMIGIWQRFQRNFELTVFELSVPDLYTIVTVSKNGLNPNPTTCVARIKAIFGNK